MADLDAARRGDHDAFAKVIAPYRRELRAHCYRMAGSLHDADDLLQESLIRAWRGLAGFEGRSSLRTWLYRVTTHACLDKLDTRAPRVLPLDLGPPSDPQSIRPPVEDASFIEPAPAELYERREAIALAFMVALQLLTPKQRAALILRDVVGMEASECAELLGLSVAAVNSALQRAREVLSSRPASAPPPDPAVLGRYVDAWDRADSGALVALLRDDATLAMPPMRDWLRGPADIGTSIASMVFAGSHGFSLLPVEANGQPAFAAYARDASGGSAAIGIHVVDTIDGKISAITAFVSPRLVGAFGLPLVR